MEEVAVFSVTCGTAFGSDFYEKEINYYIRDLRLPQW
jgi:hypothetical protein